MCKNCLKEKNTHFYNILLWVIIVILLSFGILFLGYLLKEYHGSLFSTDMLLDYIGLFFTVTGVVTGLYFIILGTFAYRTQRELDDALKNMNDSKKRINQMEYLSKTTTNTTHRDLYLLHSEMSEFFQNNANLRKHELERMKKNCSNSNPHSKDYNDNKGYLELLNDIVKNSQKKRSDYKLKQARACQIRTLDEDERISLIELLWGTRRDTDQKDIEKDILLLQNIADDDREPKAIKNAAEKGVEELRIKLKRQ